MALNSNIKRSRDNQINCHLNRNRFDSKLQNKRLKQVLITKYFGKNPHKRSPQFKDKPEMTSNVNDLEPERYVLYNTADVGKGSPPSPHPKTYVDKWDCNHVKMPNSPRNLTKNGDSKWQLIEKTLRSPMKSVADLEKAVNTYADFQNYQKFDLLQAVFTNANQQLKSDFFNRVLPAMVALALRLPQLVTQSVPILKQRQNAILWLTQEQCACLLANAFFCTFPERNERTDDYHEFSCFTFSRLFSSDGGTRTGFVGPNRNAAKMGKVRCIIAYFQQLIFDGMPTGTVSFHRKFLRRDQLPNWTTSAAMTTAVGTNQQSIEEAGINMSQMDFANEFIGGGTLSNGSVQEEIRFCICPECIVSILFTERFLDTEAFIITGAQQYTTYTGYALTFNYKDVYQDNTARDNFGRRQTEIVAIDALRFNANSLNDQLEPIVLQRELNKAYVGFVQDGNPVGGWKTNEIATGNWGCGAFNGDLYLKAVIQLMAASQAQRNMLYCKSNVYQDVAALNQELRRKRRRVSDLYDAIINYRNTRNANANLIISVINYLSALP